MEPAAISNSKTIDATQMTAFVKQVAEGKTSTNRKIVCINKKGDIQVFDNKTSADKAGFKKIQLDDIITISKQIFQKTGPTAETHTLAVSIKELSDLKKAKLQTKYHSIMSGINPKVISQKSEIAKAEKSAISMGAKSANPARLQELATSLGDESRTVTRSKGGRFGVFFLNSETTPNRTVLKLVSDPQPVKFAEGLLAKAGFNTSAPFFLPLNAESSETVIAGKVKGEIDKFKENLTPSDQLDAGAVKNLKENIRLQIKGASTSPTGCVQISKMVNGTSLAQLTPTQFERAMSDRSFVQNLGKMVLFDGFLGNDDRIQPWASKKMNFGNMMLRQTEGGHQLVLIDNSSKLDKDAAGFSMMALESLLEGKHGSGIEAYVDVIISEGKKQYPGVELNFNREQMIQDMRRGVKESANQILSMFPTDAHVKAMIEGMDLKGSIDINLVLGNLNYIRKLAT